MYPPYWVSSIRDTYAEGFLYIVSSLGVTGTLCPDNMEKKSPLFLHFGAQYGIFYTGKHFRVGKHFVAFAVLA